MKGYVSSVSPMEAWAAAKAGNRDAVRGAAHVVHADFVAELDAGRLTTVLAADSNLEVRTWSNGPSQTAILTSMPTPC